MEDLTESLPAYPIDEDNTSAIGAMIHGANDLAAMTTVATANATSDITTPENDVKKFQSFCEWKIKR
ncbi:unnamed protein product, partial [Brugia timori]|uniref:Uncharacterized protein n=1 Tax=Brugia timori TaxID=42155 RepID=A0A0R3R1W0_9BILA